MTLLGRNKIRAIKNHNPQLLRLRAVSLFSVVRQAKRETRKWLRASLVSRVSRLRRSLARALLSLNLKKKRDCSQSTNYFSNGPPLANIKATDKH